MTREFGQYSAYTPMNTTTTAGTVTGNRTTELLPCPFCGNEMHFIPTDQPRGWRVDGRHTASCPFSILIYDDCITFATREAAAESWNTRAEVGSGTCYMSIVDEYETASGEEEYLCECSECGYRRWESACDLPLFCSRCGKKVER